MRRFLLIIFCVLSFCVRAETNVVEITSEQYYRLLDSILDYYNRVFWVYSSYVNSDGSVDSFEDIADAGNEYYSLSQNISSVIEFLHLLMSGETSGSYDTSSNNILAYASSLRGYLNSFTNSLYRIDDEIHWYLPKIWERQLSLVPQIQGLYNDRFYAGNKVLELINLSSNNFERLYQAITNLDFNVSISNQIDILQSFRDGVSAKLNSISGFQNQILAENWQLRDDMNRNHGDLMDFLHSLSNSSFFASNVFNSCCCSNNLESVSNYQDSVIAMLSWMTNRWAEGSSDPTTGFGNSNTVWSVWRPSNEDWVDLLIPNLVWEQDSQSGGWRPFYRPRDEQYDGNFKRIAAQYYDLLKNYEAGDIDGQKFFTGLVDLQLHILANMSTQLYMIDEKMPTKTNLWAWIEQYKSEVQEHVTQAQDENSSAASTASALLDYTPFSMVGGYFPKVSRVLNSLRVDSDSSPVVHIPLPRALRVSDSDELIVDVRESDWFSTGRNWCRWIFTFIWGWLFIRIGLIPIFYVFFFTVRVAEVSAHLVFFGSVRGSSGIVSSFGASAVDMVFSLLGIDTDFKRFVWGIMRD